jgi:hypothetical protein
MQNYLAKFCAFFLISFLTFAQSAYSQKLTSDIKVADSLYNKGAYLKSMAIYRKILNEEQQYSPQMLLKMAYMEEALHHYANSMYYLNLYYNLHPNRAVLRKMEEVARTQGLTGYEYHDSDFFITQFKKYYMKLLEILLIVAVATVTIMALKRRQAFFKSAYFRVAFLVYLAALLYYINLLSFRKYGISKTSQAALMTEPSAAGKWFATLSSGNRLQVTNETDIWYEVEWKNQKAFIRKQNLRLLPE